MNPRIVPEQRLPLAVMDLHAEKQPPAGSPGWIRAGQKDKKEKDG